MVHSLWGPRPLKLPFVCILVSLGDSVLRVRIWHALSSAQAQH